MKTNERDFLHRPFLQTLATAYVGVWIWSAIKPVNRKDWMLENVLAVVSLSTLIKTYKKIPLSDKSYALIFAFFVLHAVGAHYTYSEVPFFSWLRDTFDLKRNHYDRLVHFLFGLLLVYPLSEVFVRLKEMNTLKAKLCSVGLITAVSLSFEVVEAITAKIVAPELGAAYLGAQGDEWDAEKDVLCAVVGALIAALSNGFESPLCAVSVNGHHDPVESDSK